MTPSNGPLRPRHVAADAVGRVVRTGAYSNVVVPAVSSDLTSGEQRRVKALVYGVLRHLATIDREIESAAGRSPSEIDDEVLDRLRVSVLEVLYSETPKPVAVSAGVDLVRETRPKAAGFANAVLRQVSTRDHAPEAMDLPSWLVSSLSAHWASEQIDRFALASAQEPPRVVRYRPGTETVGTPVAGVDGAFAIEPGPLPEGAVVQDAASIAATSALSAEPGMVVADLAAAPGGKTSHLSDQVGSQGLVVALDVHRRRVQSAASRFPEAFWVVGDGRQPPLRRGRFDRVLLDAPCSGLGTLRRRPEIAFRANPDGVAELADLQKEILEVAMGLLAPGGRLVYSVCTVTPEETIEVTEGLGFRPAPTVGEEWGDGRLLAPHLTNTDGMFIAVYNN